MEMEVSDLAGPHVKLALKGRLDTASVDRMETRFTAAIVPHGLNAIVDLSQVDFVSSMGLRMLISVARAMSRKSKRLVLFAPQEGAREVFDSVSLGEIITIRETEEDAIAALAA